MSCRWMFRFDNEAAAIADPLAATWYLPPDLPESDPDYLPGVWKSLITKLTRVQIDGVDQPGFWFVHGKEAFSEACNTHPNVVLAWCPQNCVLIGGTMQAADVGHLLAEPLISGDYVPWPSSMWWDQQLGRG